MNQCSSYQTTNEPIRPSATMQKRQKTKVFVLCFVFRVSSVFQFMHLPSFPPSIRPRIFVPTHSSINKQTLSTIKLTLASTPASVRSPSSALCWIGSAEKPSSPPPPSLACPVCSAPALLISPQSHDLHYTSLHFPATTIGVCTR